MAKKELALTDKIVKIDKEIYTEAIQLLRLHNPSLVFQGFADTNTPTPDSHNANHAWIVSETGTVFNLSAYKGRVIVDTGTTYTEEAMGLNTESFPGGAQIFDKTDYLSNTSMDSSGNLLDSDNSKTTNFIHIPDDTTHVTFSGLTPGPARRIAWFDVYKNYLSLNTSFSDSATFVIPSVAKYFLFYFQSYSDPINHAETLMLNFGSSTAPYESYIPFLKSIKGIDIKKDYLTDETYQKINNSISPDDLTLATGKQLFDKNDYQLNKIIASDGTFINSVGSKTTNYIEILSGEIILSFAGATPVAKRYAFYNDSFSVVGIAVVSASSLSLDIPSGAKYFALTFKSAADSEDYAQTLMVNFGAPQSYEDFEQHIKKILGYSFLTADSPVTAEAISQISWQYNTADAPVTGTDLYKIFTLVPNVDVDNDTLGCTGACYNSKLKQYVIAYYSFAKASKLWFYNRKDLVDYSPDGTILPVPTRELDISDHIFHIQGVAHDPLLDVYWVLGSLNAVSDNAERVLIRVNNDGDLLEKHLLPYSFQAGMLAMSPNFNNLLIKPNDKTWLLEIDKFTKQEVRQVITPLINEGLGVDYENSEVWLGGDAGTLNKYDYEDFSLIDSFTFETLPNGAYQNVESIIIDPIDKAIIFVADAYLHGGNNNGNCMWVFDFNKTIGKQVRFPQMMEFEGDKSVIIDFGEINNLGEAVIEQGDGLLMYRGSNVAPTAPVVERIQWRDKPFYVDWGSTVPSEWSVSMPNYRYMQLIRV